MSVSAQVASTPSALANGHNPRGSGSSKSSQNSSMHDDIAFSPTNMPMTMSPEPEDDMNDPFQRYARILYEHTRRQMDISFRNVSEEAERHSKEQAEQTTSRHATRAHAGMV